MDMTVFDIAWQAVGKYVLGRSDGRWQHDWPCGLWPCDAAQWAGHTVCPVKLKRRLNTWLSAWHVICYGP